MDRCPECGELLFSRSHMCLPLWETNIEDYEGDEWIKVRAVNAEDAAEKRAESVDDERTLVDGGEMFVRVKTEAGIETYSCTASVSIDYTASIVTGETSPENTG